MSRPSKINEDLIKRICGRIQVGNSPVTSAQSCNVAPTTYFRWMQLGRGHMETGKHTLYREFRESVERALAECEVTLIAVVRDAVPKQPTLAIRMLEAIAPERWSPSSRLAIKEEAAERTAPFTISLISKDRESEPSTPAPPALPARVLEGNGHPAA